MNFLFSYSLSYRLGIIQLYQLSPPLLKIFKLFINIFHSEIDFDYSSYISYGPTKLRGISENLVQIMFTNFIHSRNLFNNIYCFFHFIGHLIFNRLTSSFNILTQTFGNCFLTFIRSGFIKRP